MLTSHLTQAVNLFSPKVVKAVANDMSFNVTDIVVQRNSEVQRFESYCSTVRNLLNYCENVTDGMCYLLCLCNYLIDILKYLCNDIVIIQPSTK